MLYNRLHALSSSSELCRPHVKHAMGLLPDTKNCGLRIRRECRERFPRHRFQRKSLVSGPGMHHGTCVKHVPYCMSGSLSRGGGENVPGIPGACATLNFRYLVRGLLLVIIWVIVFYIQKCAHDSHTTYPM